MRYFKIALYFIFFTLFTLSYLLTMWWILFLPKITVRRIVSTVCLVYISCCDCLFGFKRVVVGAENKPKHKAIYAIKHQATYETFWVGWEVSNNFYVLKKQLLYIPIVGLFLWRAGMIAIDRSKGKNSIKKMLSDARKMIDKGGNFCIFPEGTRTPIGIKRQYKSGIYIMYKNLNLPVVPVAVNTGLYWDKGLWNGKSGRVTMEFLPEIKPGLGKEEFLAKLQQQIDETSDNLAKNP